MTATLLAVDDSKTMRKVLEITFAGEDYRMVLANSPADAVAKVRAERPAIALVDALLAGSSGYELCQQLKAESPGLGVIVLSSKQHPYDRVKGGAVGADDFIDKPFDSQALIDKVSALAHKLASAQAPAARPAVAAHAPAAPVPTAPGLSPMARPGIAPAQAPAGAAAAMRTTMAFGTPAVAPAAGPAATGPAKPVTPAHAAPAAQPALGHATTVGLGAVKPASAAATPAAQSAFARPVVPVAQAQVAPAPVAQAQVAPAPVAQAQVAAAAPVAQAQVAAAAPAMAAVNAAALIGASMESKLAAIGLSKDQIMSVLALSKDVVEQVVWEVVPVLAETMIREEIKRLTAE